jgi:hypothetical protein
VREELVALSKLAAMDAAAVKFDQELKDTPARLESMAADVAVLESLLARERAQLDEAEGLRTRLSEALQERIDGLSRARGKLAQAQNVRESDAGQREVDSFRRSIRDKEGELASTDEALAAKRTAMEQREAQFAEAREMLTSEETESAGRLAELRTQREAVTGGRDDLLKVIAPSTVKRYERLRTKYMDAVVVVDDGTCPGCRMALPAQLFINMQRGEELTDCPQCRRIVVYRALVEAAG